MAAAKNILRGEDHPSSKLTGDDVALIRALLDEREKLLAEANRLTDRKIAEKFDISRSYVQKLRTRAAWIHVKG